MKTTKRQRAKSGSWSNLRALSVNFKGRSRKEDQYVGDKSHSVGDTYENAKEEMAWDQEPLTGKSFSASAVARKITVLKAENGNPGDMTPRTRRKSFRQIMERISAPGNTTIPHSEKVNVPHKYKTVVKNDSFHFNLYTDALEQGFFEDREFDVWEVQERFPNDDLHLYEGMFSVVTAEWPFPASSPASPVEAEPFHRIVDPLKRRFARAADDAADGPDAARSPVVFRKLQASWSVNHSSHQQTQPSAFASRFPVLSKLSPGLQAKFKKMAQRRQSAPSIVAHSVLGSLARTSSSPDPRNENLFDGSPAVDSQRLGRKFGGNDADNRRLGLNFGSSDTANRCLGLNFGTPDDDDRCSDLNLGNLDDERLVLKLAGHSADSERLSPTLEGRDADGRHRSGPTLGSQDEDGGRLNLKLGTQDADNQRLSLKFGAQGATLNLSLRKYVMEGRVQLTTGMQTQDRYMFLFSDLLIIAKAKSGSTYKLKYRVRACELWIASCLDDVCELPKSSDKSFVMGWPTTNCVATFSTPESKELWLAALLKEIHREKERETPKSITLKIINRDSSNNCHMKVVPISHKDTAKDVVRLAVKQFGFESDDDYQLWVTSRKEGTAYPLIGHENPHAILVSHIRDFISSNGILPETEVTSVARYESFAQPEVRDRCQFVLRSSRQTPKYSADMTQRRLSRLKPKTPALFSWARKRSGQRNESSDSGHVSGNSVGSEGTASSPPSSSPPAMPKLFSLPLRQVCDDGMLPAPIATMLDVLYRKAPYKCGIFRKSANARTTRVLKHQLDEEMEVDMNEVEIHVVAALLKDFLRNIPDSVMNCSLYAKWTQAIGNPNEAEKLKSVRRLLMSLDSGNRALIRRIAILFKRIASRSDRNNMTSYNLAVCVAPSLLWPPGPCAQTEAPIKVTEIMQFFTDRCDDVFYGVAPKDTDWPPEIDVKSEDDDYFEGDIEITTARPVQEGEEQQDNKPGEQPDGHFSRSRVSRRQIQRRKSGSKAEAARLLSLSQDSLDRILDDAALATDQRTVADDMHLTIGRDPFSISIDSGFAAVGDGETGEEHADPAEKDALISAEELRRLWSPFSLRILNGQIVEEAGEAGGTDAERRELTRGFAGSVERQNSQPIVPQRRGEHSVSAQPTTRGSRLVQAIASPKIRYEDDDMTSPFFVRDTRSERSGQRGNSENKGGFAPKGRSADDRTKNVPKSQAPTEKTKVKFLSGVTVAVDDVRPPLAYQYRPVTLSIRGIADSSFKVTEFKASPCFEESFSTSDKRLLSSHEDISRDSADPSDCAVEAPKSAPLYRKFDPARSEERGRCSFLTPDAEKPQGDRASPIQILTANLQMLPDFRRRRSPRDTAASKPVVRAEASETEDSPRVGESVEARLSTGAKQPTSGDSKTKLKSGSLSVEDGTFSERNDRTRTRLRRNLASKLSSLRAKQEVPFSQSLPSSAWGGAESGACDVVNRLKQPSASIRETDILLHPVDAVESTNGEATSQKVQLRTNVVKSKVSPVIYPTSGDGPSLTSPVEFVLRGDAEGLRIIRKSRGATTPLAGRNGEVSKEHDGLAGTENVDSLQRRRDVTSPFVLRRGEKLQVENFPNHTESRDVPPRSSHWGSPASVRCGRGDSRTAPQYSRSPTWTRYTGGEPVVSSSVRRDTGDGDALGRDDAPFPLSPKDKNSSEVLPFLGFDNVTNSAESFV